MTALNRNFFVAALLSGSVAIRAFAGDLTPPVGPITPTHKTLTEVEPRIAVNATNTPGDANSVFRIAAAGSYYLTGNLTGQSGKHGIEIDADGVTLDLMGFEVAGVAGSTHGIYAQPSAARNEGDRGVPLPHAAIIVRNGRVRNWGQIGVNLQDGLACRVEGVTAYLNGNRGIAVALNSVVTDCTLHSNAGGGIVVIGDCAVRSCEVWGNSVSGISASGNSLVERCRASFNTIGISVSGGSSVISCVANQNTTDGILVNEGYVFGNQCRQNGQGGDGAGIHATGANSRIEGNNVTGADRGIDVDAGANLIIRNSARGNTTNYDIAAGNTVGPTVTSATIATNENPHANYDFQ